jgi:phosphohistidine phosphatase
MKLYFLRHGLAGQHGDPRYKDDSLRPLTKEGRKKMHRVVLGMKALGLKFDCLLSSPYIRARQTAEVVAEVYKIKNKDIHLTSCLLPPSSAGKLLNEVRTRFPKAENILLTGHEPHLTETISALLKSKQHLPIDFKKGGLCCLSLEGKGQALLLWLLTPDQMDLMAKEKR